MPRGGGGEGVGKGVVQVGRGGVPQLRTPLHGGTGGKAVRTGHLSPLAVQRRRFDPDAFGER